MSQTDAGAAGSTGELGGKNLTTIHAAAHAAELLTEAGRSRERSP